MDGKSVATNLAPVEAHFHGEAEHEGAAALATSGSPFCSASRRPIVRWMTAS